LARILVIDDDEQVLDLIKEMLKPGGHEVTLAESCKKGVELYKQKPADLIITDIFMPEADGLQTIMNLRRDFGDLKIIAISGGGKVTRIDFLKIAMSIGAMAALKKPFTQEHQLCGVHLLYIGEVGGGFQ